MGEEAHSEGRREAEHLRTDVADAELAQRTAGEAHPHLVAPPRPARRPHAGQPVLDDQPAGERQHEGQHRHGHGPAHPLRRDDERDAGRRAGRDVDIVVADAEARDEAQAAARRDAARIEAGRQQDQGVEALQVAPPA